MSTREDSESRRPNSWSVEGETERLARRRGVRGSKTAVVAGLVVTAATATILKAQQMLGGPGPAATTPPAAVSAPVDPDLAQRSARQLLNNGLSYLNEYQDYDHALKFLREAAIRPQGLSARERKQLADALARTEQGKADAGTAVAS